MNGKEFVREIDVSDMLFLYNVRFCPDYLTAELCKRVAANNSKYIGCLICLNHPSTDGNHPHWRITVEILQQEKNLVDQGILQRFVDVLLEHSPVIEPIWIEAKAFESFESMAVGDLWTDE